MDNVTKAAQEAERKITWHPMAVTRERREALLGQNAVTIWLRQIYACKRAGTAVCRTRYAYHAAGRGQYTLRTEP